MDKMANKWQLSVLSAAFDQWDWAVDGANRQQQQQERATSTAMVVVRQWQHRVKTVAFKQWINILLRSRQREAAMERMFVGVRRWQHSLLWAAFDQWEWAVVGAQRQEEQRQRAVSRAMIAVMEWQHRMVFAAFNQWAGHRRHLAALDEQVARGVRLLGRAVKRLRAASVSRAWNAWGAAMVQQQVGVLVLDGMLRTLRTSLLRNLNAVFAHWKASAVCPPAVVQTMSVQRQRFPGINQHRSPCRAANCQFSLSSIVCLSRRRLTAVRLACDRRWLRRSAQSKPSAICVP